MGGWRGIFCTEQAHLSFSLGQLCIKQKDKEAISIPLEDLAFIVLDNQQISLTGALLAACADVGCLLITTNPSHLPNGLLQSFHVYYRQLEIVELQFRLSTPRKKNLWQYLIKAKIENQSKCLDLIGLIEASSKIQIFIQKVRSGDPDNIESQAARTYWRQINPNFGRDSEGGDRLNVLLNYGYALLRSSVSQILVAYGFLPCLGIHHVNQQNAFNLADDLIEPWRPLADYYIISYWQKSKSKDSFDTKDRQQLLNILFSKVLWIDGEQQLLQCMRRYVEQLRSYYNGTAKIFNCPTFPLGNFNHIEEH